MTRPAKLLLPILFVCLLLGATSVVLLRLTASLGNAPAESIPTAAGAVAHAVLTPTLLDAATGEPICGGVVCIPEASLRAKTAANGKTAPLRVPVLPDSRYSEVQSAPWGELLLLAYAEGYVPTAYLYRGIYAESELAGPVIRLATQTESSPAFCYLAADPDPLWVQTLLTAYAPK